MKQVMDQLRHERNQRLLAAGAQAAKWTITLLILIPVAVIMIILMLLPP
jgi:hypothetical protein